MRFYMPTMFYQETDAVKKHAKELAALVKKAFLITGKHSSKVNGSLADVEVAL